VAAHSGPPDSEEIEVTLLGRGEGESCLVHLGDHQWMIVDSFNDTVAITRVIGGVANHGTRTEPAALTYLRDLYDPAPLPDVSAVVLTHFHSDHYGGIVELHRTFPSAMFAVPDAMSWDKFMKSMNANSTSELRGIGLHIIRTGKSGRSRRSTLRKVAVTNVLIPSVNGSAEVAVMAPSQDAKNEIAEAIASIATGAPVTEYERVLNDDNTTSIALYVHACGTRVLLGGDVVNSPSWHGWPAVMRERFNKRPPVQIVKVPHHGADTAHHDPMWEVLVENGSPMLVAPFWNKTRPRWADQRRLVDLGPLYQTGPSNKRWSSEWLPVAESEAQTGRITARRKDGEAFTWSFDGPAHQVDPPDEDPASALAGSA
jgi:ribonuclease BN (tRNA processing enzyme)